MTHLPNGDLKHHNSIPFIITIDSRSVCTHWAVLMDHRQVQASIVTLQPNDARYETQVAGDPDEQPRGHGTNTSSHHRAGNLPVSHQMLHVCGRRARRGDHVCGC